MTLYCKENAGSKDVSGRYLWEGTMKISVAMAYYNGGEYIEEQLSSILAQLGAEDEVVVSVDAASDGSGEILEQRAREDSRIQLLTGPSKGVVKNFENAITHCAGDIIFLSDQDDIWKDGKVEKVIKAFRRSGVMAVLHNAEIINEKGQKTEELTLFEMRNSRSGLLKNFLKNSYMGCCMAFRRELLPVLIPIPEQMYMHDYWIGTAAELCGGVGLLKEPLIGYRRHGGNVTDLSHGVIWFMLKKRMNILRCLGILKKRIKNMERL